MNYLEAIASVQSGNNVTQKSWFSGVYLTMKDGKIVIVWPDGDTTIYRSDVSDRAATDWEIVE